MKSKALVWNRDSVSWKLKCFVQVFVIVKLIELRSGQWSGWEFFHLSVACASNWVLIVHLPFIEEDELLLFNGD